MLAGVHAKRQSGIKRQGGIFADVKGAQDMVALDGSVADRIHVLCDRHHFTGRECANVELSIRQRTDALAKLVG